MTDRIYCAAESDEYRGVSYVAVAPRRRDFWRVLLGRYTPEVKRTSAVTAKGMDRTLREVWTKEAIQGSLDSTSPLMAELDRMQ